jgi:hypothetical protein
MAFGSTSIARLSGFVCLLIATAITGGCGEDAERSPVREKYMAKPPDSAGTYQRADSPEVYDRESIFTYIDGAGEVYNAYDFREVEVWRYHNPDSAEIVAEIFDMGKPEDAYGVFTYARQEEQEGLGQAYESRGGTTCFWQGRYFVCVATYQQDDEARAAVDRIARQIDQQLPREGKIPALVQSLPDSGLVDNSVRFFHLHSVLNYHYYLARDNVLNLSERTDAVLAEYEFPEGLALVVRYPDSTEAGEAYRSFITNYLKGDGASPQQDEEGQWLAHQHRGSLVIIVFSVPAKDSAQELIERLGQATTQLEERE